MSKLTLMFEKWRHALNQNKNAGAFDIMDTARKCESKEDQFWLNNALGEADVRRFVASIYVSKPVPNRILKEMIYAGMVSFDASNIRATI